MERRLNKDIIWCVLILAILCTTGAVGSYIWLSSLPGDNILFLQAGETDNIALSAFYNFWTFVIILQVRQEDIVVTPALSTVEFMTKISFYNRNVTREESRVIS